jgi:hypothetical protein
MSFALTTPALALDNPIGVHVENVLQDGGIEMERKTEETTISNEERTEAVDEFKYDPVPDIQPMELVDNVFLSGQVSSASGPARPSAPEKKNGAA